MSKESYARGFVKAAQAMGVDPVQLAKYAATNDVSAVSGPKRKTDGWAPLFVRLLDKSEIPYVEKANDIYYPNARTVSDVSDKIPSGVEQDSVLGMDVKGRKMYDKKWAGLLLHSHDKGDGKLYNWYMAHRDALDAANKVFRKGLFSSNYDDAAKAYHQSMLNSTGTPVRVSSQIKK